MLYLDIFKPQDVKNSFDVVENIGHGDSRSRRFMSGQGFVDFRIYMSLCAPQLKLEIDQFDNSR